MGKNNQYRDISMQVHSRTFKTDSSVEREKTLAGKQTDLGSIPLWVTFVSFSFFHEKKKKRNKKKKERKKERKTK